MKKLSFSLFIILNCLFTFATVIAAPLPDLSAEGAILMEAKTGTILYAKNMNSVFYPASTTKVLTCLILAEENQPSEILTKSAQSITNVPTDSSHIGLLRGDSYSATSGLHGILMGSDNYISYDMAVDNAGSIANFADKMNEKARMLGTRKSHFVNPHGYHDPNHYTTPYDLGRITRAAFSNSMVLDAAGSSKYTFDILNRNVSLQLKHTAALLDSQSPYYNPHVVAAKTGYHTPAGYTLVAKAVYDDIELIGVVMKTQTPQVRFKEMNALFSYGEQNFKLVGDSNTGYRMENISYSSWSKPYVAYALEHQWIAPTIESYQTEITKRTFLHILENALPSDYVPSWNLDTTSRFSPSLLNEPISGTEAKKILEQLSQELVPFSPFDLVQSLDIQSLNSTSHLTLEQTLCIAYTFQKTLATSAPYIFLSHY